MRLFTTIITLFILFITTTAAAYSQTPHFDRLKVNFEENRVFKAEFSHKYKDAFTGEEQFSEGQIWIGKNRYKIEGNLQTMVVDGELSTVYDRNRNRIIISDYIEEEDDFAPSRMLQGVDESFQVEESELNDNRVKIEMVSDDPFSIFREVTIFLDQNGFPEQIMAIDQVDNELLTRFESGEFISADNELFELNVPDDTERVDMRHDTE
jgi:outer membrane lipoprotein-sorting protein